MAMTQFRAPALPAPSNQYDQRQQTDLVRALRIYFNWLDSLTPQQAQSYTADNFYGGLFSGFGRGLFMPYICVQDLADQTLTTALTPKRVAFNNVVTDNEMFYVGNDGIHVSYDGMYFLQYSFQLVNTENAQHYAWIWVRKNGVDLPGSATKFSVLARKSASLHSYVCAVSNVVVPLEAGDYVEVWWAADAIYVPATSDGIYMEYYTADSEGFTHPSVPSAIVTMTFMSALPESTVTGVVALGQIGSVAVTGGAKAIVSSVSASGYLGATTEQGGADASLTGVSGTGSVDAVSVTTTP